MKSVLAIASMIALMTLSHPVRAEQASLIGDPKRFCQGWLDKKRVNPPPKDPNRWVGLCGPAAQQQDDCVRNTGWQPGQKATEATTQCWRIFMGSLNAIPVN